MLQSLGRFLRPRIVFPVLAVVLLLGTGVMKAGASTVPALRKQMQTIATSANAKAVDAQLATLVSDPALGQWAAELITQGGSSLTSFQLSLLKAVETESQYGGVLAKLLNGVPLSSNDRQRFEALTVRLSNNAALQQLSQAGKHLKESSNLSQDISTVINVTNGPKLTPTPTGDVPQDTILAELSSIISSSSFTALSSSVIPVLSDPGAPAFISSLDPLVIATYLPPSQVVGLQLPAASSSFSIAVFKAQLEIIGGIAGMIAVIALAPEVLTVTAVIGITAGLIASLAGFEIGLLDLGTALDCDNDGDPWDSAESSECP